MPTLPLDHPMPIMAVYGIMLYPRDVAADTEKARNFADFHLRTALEALHEEGGNVPEHLMGYLQSEAVLPKDVDKQTVRGTIAGEIFKTAFELVLNDPEKASWQSAYRILSQARKERGLKKAGERTLREIRDHFLRASHLWAALDLRQRDISGEQAKGYDAMTDFNNFLFEAEILRYYGRNWIHSREKAEPLLPTDVWHVPYYWTPPEHQPNWPEGVGKIAHYSIGEEFKAHLRRRGRPKKT